MPSGLDEGLLEHFTVPGLAPPRESKDPVYNAVPEGGASTRRNVADNDLLSDSEDVQGQALLQ